MHTVYILAKIWVFVMAWYCLFLCLSVCLSVCLYHSHAHRSYLSENLRVRLHHGLVSLSVCLSVLLSVRLCYFNAHRSYLNENQKCKKDIYRCWRFTIEWSHCKNVFVTLIYFCEVTNLKYEIVRAGTKLRETTFCRFWCLSSKDNIYRPRWPFR